MTVGSGAPSPKEHVGANGETRRFLARNVEESFEREPPATVLRKRYGRRHVLARGQPWRRESRRETIDRHPKNRRRLDPSFLEEGFSQVLERSPGSSHPWRDVEAVSRGDDGEPV